MKEQKQVTFNHGFLCEMLRMASDNELANVINDVQKIQKQREAARKQIHTIAIKNAIEAAIKDGYSIGFGDDDAIFVLNSSNLIYTNIIIEED